MGDRYSHILDDEENNAFIKKLVKDAEDAVQLFIKNNNKCDTSGLSDVSMYDLMLMYDAQGGPGPNFNYLGGI